MSRWDLDRQTSNPFAMGLVQPACGTCGGEDSLESRYPFPNPVANEPLTQGFLELNTSLDKALFNGDFNNGRSGVLVLGAGPTSSTDIESSITHELQIASILNNSAGVAGNDIHVGFVRELPNESSQDSASEFVEDSESAFKEEVISAFCRELNNTTLALYTAQTNIANNPQLQRIGQINMSFTISPKIGADVLFQRLEYTDAETGEPAFTQLRNAVYGPFPSTDESKRYQQALDYVQTLVSNSSPINRARETYSDQVRALKNEGVRCIVATGNENHGNHGADVSDGEAFNLFCTPDTINVAAATADGNVAAFSSRSGKHNDTTPTVMALGQDVPVATSLDTLDGDKNGSINGTSFAAPQVTGLLSRLNQYKDLSAEEEDAWLVTLQDKGVIEDTDAPKRAEGMGFFNPKGFDVAA